MAGIFDLARKELSRTPNRNIKSGVKNYNRNCTTTKCFTFGNLPKTSIISTDKFLEYIDKVSKRPRILHDIIPCYSSTDVCEGSNISLHSIRKAKQVAEKIHKHFESYTNPERSKRGYEGGFFIWAYHPQEGNEHIHTIHDCRYFASRCRCFILSQIPVKRRTRRGRYDAECTISFYDNLSKYFNVQKGIDFYVFMPAYSRYLVRSNGDLSIARSNGERPVTNMETTEFEDRNLCERETRQAQLLNGISSGVQTLGEEANFGSQAMPVDRKTKEILQFLWTFLVCPPENCCRTNIWLQNNTLINIFDTDECFKKAITLYKRLISNLSLQEIYDKYNNKTLLFDTTDANLSVMYYGIDESIEILKKFLIFQVGLENYDEFLATLFNVLNKSNGKKNTIWIKGPPDCAKSWFVSSIEGFMISVGKTSIMNRTNHFCLSSCSDCRLIILDELVYEPIYTDTLKLLFGGNTCKVAKKYTDDVTIFKTPCIVMSNGECIPDIKVFSTRVQKYTWSSLSTNLRDDMNVNVCHKKIHPFAFLKYWKEQNMFE